MKKIFLFALLVYIFATLIDGNVITMYKNEFLKGMEETKFMFSDEMYEQTIENMDKITIINIAFTDFLAKMLGDAHLYVAIDINMDACIVTKATAFQNKVFVFENIGLNFNYIQRYVYIE